MERKILRQITSEPEIRINKEQLYYVVELWVGESKEAYTTSNPNDKDADEAASKLMIAYTH